MAKKTDISMVHADILRQITIETDKVARRLSKKHKKRILVKLAVTIMEPKAKGKLN